MISIGNTYVVQFEDGSFFRYGTWHGLAQNTKGEYDIGKTNDLNLAEKSSENALKEMLREVGNQEKYILRKVKMEITYKLI